MVNYLPPAVLVFLLAWVALPMLLPAATPWPGDLGDYTRPQLDYARTTDAPWIPYINAGRHGLYDGAIYPRFYPLYWFYLHTGSPGSFAWGALAHLIWAGWGMYFFIRLLGRGRLAAAYAALLFAGGAFFTARLFAGQYPHIASASWAPWVFAAAHKLFTYRRPLDAVWLGVAAAGQLLAGYPQILFITLFGCSLFVVALLQSPAARSVLNWRLLAVLCMLAATVFLLFTASYLLPLSSVIGNSARVSGMSFDQAGVDSFNPRELLQLWQPFRYHEPYAPENIGTLSQFWETAAYVGISPWLILIAGIALGSLRHFFARLCLVLAVLALGMAFGKYAVIFPLAWQAVPLLNRVRVPGRFLLLFLIAFAVLTAYALDRVRLRWPALQRRSSWLLLVLLAVELAVAAWPVLGRPFPARLSSPYWSQTNRTVEYLQAQPGPSRLLTLAPLTMLNESFDYRLENCGGYLALIPRRYQELIAAFETGPVNSTPLRFRAPFGPRGDSRVLLDLLDVRYVVSAAGDWPGGDSSAVKPVFSDGTVVTWQVSGGPGRAWLTHLCQRLDDDTAVLAALIAPGFAPDRTALVCGILTPNQNNAVTVPDSLCVAAASGEISVAYVSDTDGVLVFSEHWGAGWKVTLDGEPALSFPVDHALTGIVAPVGSHRAVARFIDPYPPTLRFALALVVLLGSLYLFFYARTLIR